MNKITTEKVRRKEEEGDNFFAMKNEVFIFISFPHVAVKLHPGIKNSLIGLLQHTQGRAVQARAVNFWLKKSKKAFFCQLS